MKKLTKLEKVALSKIIPKFYYRHEEWFHHGYKCMEYYLKNHYFISPNKETIQFYIGERSIIYIDIADSKLEEIFVEVNFDSYYISGYGKSKTK